VELRDELIRFREVLRASRLDHAFTFDYTYLAERDWNETWKKKFVPIDVGDTFAVLPPWEKAPPGRIPIIVDPGMAFGTGHHETTKTCLALLERFAAKFPGGRFLDVGTGTGILLVAAARLGFSSLRGVDIDPLAVDAARRNAELNGIDASVILQGTIAEAEGTYDLVTANLMAGVLVAIAGDLSRCLSSTGAAILSGMLVGQEPEVLAALDKTGLLLIEQVVEGRWVSLVLSPGAGGAHGL
jgi:ribosomal protein L11 methyltransferase